MRAFRRFKTACAVAFSILLVFLLLVSTARAEDQSAANNRFNVVIVVDASASMKDTDPERLRFEAINQFATLLAERGNSLGGVVFTEHIADHVELAPANSSDDKAKVTEKLEKVEPKGDTNIGEALSTAMNMLKASGNKDLPSVILLLSDGNTDLPGFTAEEVQASHDKKAEAVQQARNEGVRIYSVCLNADNKADVSEMKQISDATHGEMIEVKRAEDLQDVFNKFYNYVYGSSTQTIQEGVFPQNGKLETEFDIPALGVEEINVVLYGNATKHTISNPAGKTVEPIATKANTFTLLKITDVVPGKWKLVTEGVPGDSIKINMVFNSNLGVRVEVEPKKDMFHPDDELAIRAFLSQAGEEANSAKQYAGYEAELQVFNGLDNQKLDTLPMQLGNSSFELKHKFAEGTYRFVVHVKGNYLERSSNMLGPYTVSASAASEEAIHNTPPEAVVNPLEATVVVWPSWSPVGAKSYELDLTTLATDQQDEKLNYAIVDSSFMEGDYTVDGNKLTVTNFSISKGEFNVRAADHLGAYCDIKVIVNSHSVAFIVLVLTLVGLAIAVVALLFGLYKALHMFPRGTVNVHSNVNGAFRGENNISWRGRLKLNRCNLDSVGLDYNKSYIQATGKQYVELRTNIPVMYAGQATKKVRLENGVTTVITVQDGKSLEIRFNSDLEGLAFGKRPKAPKVPKPPRRPKPPKPPKAPKPLRRPHG